MDAPWISDEELEQLFEPGVLSRGRQYWRSGAVAALKRGQEDGDQVLQAKVHGSERRPYQLNVRWQRSPGGRLSFSNGCSCPLGGDCKHVVAALLAGRGAAPPVAVVSPPAAVASPTAAAPQDRDSAQARILELASRYGLPVRLGVPASAPALDPALQDWLNQVERNSTPPQFSEAAGLLYGLDQAALGGAPGQLRIWHARRLKSGGWSGFRPYGHNAVRGALIQPPGFVRDGDQPILRLLDSLPYETPWSVGTPGTHTRYSLRGRSGARILGLLLATGRCAWGDPTTSPTRWLAEGPPRRASWAWQALDDGSQQLRLDAGEGLRVLAAEPPWYVDPEAGLAGTLDSGLPEALAATLAAAPPVPPEHRALVAERLAAQLPAGQVPLPSTEPLQLHEDVLPQPVLLLYGEEQRFGYASSRGRHAGAAQVWFDYDGLRLRPSDSRQALSQRRAGVVRRIARQPAEEQRRLAELKRLSALRAVPSCFHPWEINRIETRDLSIPRPGDQETGWREFQEQAQPRLVEHGWRIEHDPGFPFRYAQVEDWYGVLSDDGEGRSDWFGLELGVLVDGERVNLLPILIQALRRDGLAQSLRGPKVPETLSLDLPDGRRLRLPGARLAPLVATLLELVGDRTPAEGPLRLSRLDAGRLLDLEAANPELRGRWQGGSQLLELGRRLADLGGIPALAPPQGLRAQLRPYQQQGLDWLQFLRAENLGGILADDMGLGKTVQTLAHLLLEQEQGRLQQPALIVCPTSLIGNWRREAERFAPSLRVLVLHGAERKGRHAVIAGHDLIITSYALLRVDQAELAAQDFSWLILDEAQNIKNAASTTARQARSLKAARRLCLTGTPLENHLGELWSQFHFLMPGLLGDDKEFKRLYRNPIEKQGDNERRARLRRRVAPFLLRRTKQQVAHELPAKTEILRSVALDGAQRDLYETVRLTMDAKLRQEIARQGLERSQIVMLDALLKLRQVCCDPRLVKLEAARKAAQHSAKLELLMELLPPLLEEGRRVLLFSQFTAMLALIEERLGAQGIAYAKLTGQTRQRDAEVARFQSGEVPLFLLSLKAGGVGLNLTAADTVIHYDPWWNPAAENQATDRAHRIGQDKPVFVYRLIVEGSVEERIQALQARKAALFAGLVGEADEGLAPKFGAEDLAELLRPLDD